MWRLILLLLTLSAVAHAGAPETKPFDPNPWIDDLHQIRAAFAEKYANFAWAVFEREIDLPALFARTEDRLQDTASDDQAKAAIDRMMRTLGDAHVQVRWPAPQTPTPRAHPDLCQMPLGPHIPGYHSLPDDDAPEFPSGWIQAAAQKVGVIRIALFAPAGSPTLCPATLTTLAAAPNESAAYQIMSHDLAARIRALQRLRATTLLIDLTGNGGGSQWAEAAARIVSPLKLHSERRDFVRGQHWADHWDSVARTLRQAQDTASAADRARLDRWAQQADRAKIEANTPCSSEPFWSGQWPNCEWLANGFYATGLLAAADATELRGKAWGALVFSPAEYDFEEAVWHGPLLVLVDAGTGSAAEEFTAVLQDNRAAVVLGAPTAGAGCGHTDGGTPTTLTHSGGILELPDCARLRSDGSNEVTGIEPDILIGFRSTDGLRRKGLRVAAALPRGIAAAVKRSSRHQQ